MRLNEIETDYSDLDAGFSANISDVDIVDDLKDYWLNISTNATEYSNVTSILTLVPLLEFIEFIKDGKMEQLAQYKVFAIAVGFVIVISNIVVVISSGLILKKGQEPKSTYLLLGNVSLADTFIGFNLVFGLLIDRYATSTGMCLVHIGIVGCPTMASMLTVSLIAIDRYIYIVHGLHYYRWVTTRRIRLAIFFTWFISIVFAFLPAMGWSMPTKGEGKCWYADISPPGFLYLSSAFAFVTILIVCILNTVILLQALSQVKQIRSSSLFLQDTFNFREKRNKKKKRTSIVEIPTVFEPRNENAVTPAHTSYFSISCPNLTHLSVKSNDLCDCISKKVDTTKIIFDNDVTRSNLDYSASTFESALSVTIETNVGSTTSVCHINGQIVERRDYKIVIDKNRKLPNQCKAIAVVILTSGCFICTWLPYFISIVIFRRCGSTDEDSKHCLEMEVDVTSSLAVLGLCNSILNPMIYAWWHKGFKRSFRQVFFVYCKKRSD